MPYVPALDGIRAIAVTLVLLFHAQTPFMRGGFLGVDVFFVLSGFLITKLLREEYEATGHIDKFHFYGRRIARLTPPLILLLVVYCSVAPFLWPNQGDHYLQALIAFLYISDYSVAFFRMPSQLGHTWSLSVEAHFYLVWPIVFGFACIRFDKKKIIAILFLLYSASVLWKITCIIQGQSWEEVYFRFDTRLSGFFLGALLAVSLSETVAAKKIERALPVLLWLIPVSILLLHNGWGESFMLQEGMLIAELTAAVIIFLIMNPGGALSKALSLGPIVTIGKLSYGIYLWHYPIFRYFREIMPWNEVLLIGVPMSIGLATISYIAVENTSRKFLLKRLTRIV